MVHQQWHLIVAHHIIFINVISRFGFLADIAVGTRARILRDPGENDIRAKHVTRFTDPVTQLRSPRLGKS